MNSNRILTFLSPILIIMLSILVITSPPHAALVAATIPLNRMPIRSVKTERKAVSITFDTGGHARNIEKILAILSETAVTAEFFVCGYWIDSYPEAVKAIHQAGHGLGNHSDTHPFLARLAPAEITNEISRAHRKVAQLTGVEMNLFRAPYDSINHDVLVAAGELSYHTVQWSIDSSDWKASSGEVVYQNVMTSPFLKNGAIILFHDHTLGTLAALKQIIEAIKAEGYEILPLTELMHQGNYRTNNMGEQIALP